MKFTASRNYVPMNYKCFRCHLCLMNVIFTMAPYKLQYIWMVVNNVFNFSWVRKHWMAVNNVFNFSWVRNVHWMNEKPTRHKPYKPAPIEHIANVVTHGVWVVPSIIGCFALIQRATSRTQYWSAVIYGTALVLLFAVSTFFHSVFYCSRNRYLKDMLHRSDRAMIYVFIAASYFPWLMLKPLPPGGLAAELHWIIWVLASLGILYQQLFHEQYKCLEIFFYLFMGIAPSLALIIGEEDFLGLTELKIGGFVYVFGVIFFKSDGKIPFAHAIWHLFVVMASGIHYYAILNYLYPTNDIYT